MNPQQSSSNKTYNVNTLGTVLIPGKFILIGITINTKGASSNTTKLYDAGTQNDIKDQNKKGTIDTVNMIGNLPYNIPMLNGIGLVVATGTAPDLTIIYADMA